MTTLKNLRSQLAAELARSSERSIERRGALDGHKGFGQEPIPGTRARPPNTALSFFVMEHLRAPNDEDELAAFMRAREAAENTVPEQPPEE